MRKQKAVQIISGIAVLACLAAASAKPASARGRAALCVLIALSAALGALELLMCIRVRHAEASPADDSSEAVAVSPRGLLRFIMELLALAGRHALLLLVVHRCDHFFLVLYREYTRTGRVLHRVTVDLALMELIVLCGGRLAGTVLMLCGRLLRAAGRKSSPAAQDQTQAGHSPLQLFGKASADLTFIRTYRRWNSLVFYIAFGYAYCCRFVQNTMFSRLVDNEDLPIRLYRQAILFCLLLAVFAAAAAKRTSVMLLQLLLLTAGFLNYRQGGNKQLLFALCVLIVAAAGKSARVILSISVVGGLLSFSFGYAGIRLGITPEYVARTLTEAGIRKRYTFGIISPTDCAAHLFFLVAARCALRRPRRKWHTFLAYIPMLFLFYLSSHYCYARVASFCMLLVILVSIARQFVGADPFAERGASSAPALPGRAATARAVGFLLTSVWLVFPAWCFYMMRQADMASVWIPLKALLARFLNMESLEQRIRISQMTFRSQPLTLFGAVIKERGYGGGAGTSPERYSFMDISYIKLLFNGGIVLTALLLFVILALSVRCLREKRFYLLFVLACVALDCLFEHHIYEFFYNVFPLLLFASFGRSSGRSRPQAT